MAKCKHETKNGICEIHSSYSYCYLCDSENLCKGYEPKTNADRIRAMNDEALACYLSLVEDRKSVGVVFEDTSDKWLEWLKQPARE